MAGFGTRLKHAWNAFAVQRTAETEDVVWSAPASYGGRPDRSRMRVSNERSIISSIYVRLGVDAAQVDIRHVRLDDDNRYIEDMDTMFNDCLTIAANIDQPARAFRQDIYLSLFDKGTVALVPVDTTSNPVNNNSYDIKTMRVGEIITWYPQHVKVNVYNENRGVREEIYLPKTMVSIVENPLYSVMNEANSTLQRLIRKLNILDAVDEAAGSGKLDLIIQLPYVIKSEARRQQAQQRRDDIEFQLKGSQYGIAYTDGTEKITQLNRPAENNLLKQIEYLTAMLYSQLGLTVEVMNGTADAAAMLNYYNRTIEPLVTSVVEAMHRTFLTKTARTQKQAVMFFRDPFKLVPINDIAEIADKFTRNEILTANEIRQIVGFKPSKDKGADKLKNSNMPAPTPTTNPANVQGNGGSSPSTEEVKGDSQNGS